MYHLLSWVYAVRWPGDKGWSHGASPTPPNAYARACEAGWQTLTGGQAILKVSGPEVVEVLIEGLRDEERVIKQPRMFQE
jgi:hypothetical protein